LSLALSYKNPNYCAIVVELENFKVLEGCDNLKAALILGSQVIVSNNSHAGELGLFFPVECQLSHDFLKANNLYRNSSFNVDPEKKGYFEENRRIRCVKFRGHKSEGIFLPLSSLEYLLGSDLQELEVGAEFDSINETEVCCKYVLSSVMKHGSNNNGVPGEKAVSRLVEGQVTLHFDTLNLKKNIHSINPNDFISVSNKTHGCVSGDTVVNTEEFGDMKISNIVNDKVKCSIKAFDVKKKKEVYVPIDQYYFKENDGDWYELELEDGTKIEITSNNPVWLPELKCYRRVDELKVGDALLKN